MPKCVYALPCLKDRREWRDKLLSSDFPEKIFLFKDYVKEKGL